MDTPSKEDLQRIGQAVNELRQTVESKSVDHEKIERISAFLDDHEEKFNQPLIRAVKAQEAAEDEIKELQEKLEQAGLSAAEAKGRMDALEAEIALRGRSGSEVSYKSSAEYMALTDYCKKGRGGISEETKQLLRTDINTEGGFLVPSEMDNVLVRKITELDPIRSIARVRPTGAKSLEMAIRNTIPVATYEGEGDTGGVSTSTYEISTVVPFRQTVTIPITWDMLQDSAFDMDSEIMNDAALAFAYGEGNNFVSGDGHKKPHGFVVNSTLQAGARPSAASGVLDPEAIILITGDVKVGYNPVYVLNRRTLALIRTFRADAVSAADSAGNFLWQPGILSADANGPVGNTINGFPYVLANSMPDVAADTYPIAFGDFSAGYTIVDRTATAVVRDEVTSVRQATVNVTVLRWNTGQLTLEDNAQGPIKLLHVIA